MRFALNALREVATGTPERRKRALMTFALWFVAGAYITSTFTNYVLPHEGFLFEALGGAAVASLVAAIS